MKAKKNSISGPSFLCIGAQKAGTSWLYKTLNLHPQVSLPPQKELHFFDDAEFYKTNTLFNRLRYFRHHRNQRWYRILTRGIGRHLLHREKDEAIWTLRYLMAKRSLTAQSIKAYNKLFSVENRMISGDITPSYSLLNEQTIKAIKDHLPQLKVIYILRAPVERDMSQISMHLRDAQFESIEQLPDHYFEHFLKNNDHSYYQKHLLRG